MTTLATSTADSVSWFESTYAAADGDLGAVPWAAGAPSPALINWLNAAAPSILRCGARTCVTGCGLGDDAVALLHRGYDVTAFDISDTAIEWARQRFPECARSFTQGDLLQSPAKWRHRFDLVADVNNLHWFPAPMQEDAIRNVADLMSPHGRLLIIAVASGSSEAVDESNRTPVCPDALTRAASLAGLTLCEPATVFEDDDAAPTGLRLRALLERA